MRLFSVFILLAFLSACSSAPVYMSEDSAKSDMTLIQAIQTLYSSAQEMAKNNQCNSANGAFYNEGPKQFTITRQDMTMRCGTQDNIENYNATKRVAVGSGYTLQFAKKGEITYWSGTSFWWFGPSEQGAINFSKAWSVMGRLTSEDGITWPDFANVAQSYRAAKVKPQLPEGARAFKVQAESAVRTKRFADAARHFEQALQLMPAWPEGHFNLALIIGELGFFPEAIGEMQRYLLLVPEAANARSAQDKIYEWQAKK